MNRCLGETTVAFLLPFFLLPMTMALEPTALGVLRLGNSSHTISKYCVAAFTTIKKPPVGPIQAEYRSYDFLFVNTSCGTEMGQLQAKIGILQFGKDSCAFDTVVTMAAAAGAYAILFVRQGQTLDTKFFGVKYVAPRDVIVGTIRNETSQDITEKGDLQSKLAIYVVHLNVSMGIGIIWFLACITVAVGSVWSGSTRKTLFLMHNWRTLLPEEKEDQKQDDNGSKDEKDMAVTEATDHASLDLNAQKEIPEAEIPIVPTKKSKRNQRIKYVLGADDHVTFTDCPVDCQLVVTFVLLMGVSLLLMYYFFNKLVHVLTICIMLGAMMALIVLLDGVAVLIPFASVRIPNMLFPCFVPSMELRHHLVLLIALGLPVLWYVFKDHDNGWILQNMLGISLAVNIIRCFQLPNFKLISLICTFLFFYDIFMVFVTALLQKGVSVMEEVASGVQKLPVVVRVPYFDVGELEVCLLQGAGALLGYGDIVVPGIAVAYCRGYDVLSKRRSLYFLVSLLGYCGALVGTFIGAMLMESGQPALLYLVPGTLIPALLLSWCRGDFNSFWTGEIVPKSGLLASRENVLRLSMSTERLEMQHSRGLLQVDTPILPWLAIPMPVTQQTYDARWS